MKYFFIPGRNYDLSKAELIAVLSSHLSSTYNFHFAENYILVDSKENADTFIRIFNRLGGFTSCGVLYDDIDNILEELTDLKKITFGLSVFTDSRDKYSKKGIKDVLEGIKGLLKERGVSSRYLIPNGLMLDTAQVLHNRILEKGFELVIFDYKARVQYGKTLAVQNIGVFSEVEFDKPYTNKAMGVLPAKLATIMVNLLGLKDGDTLWDPFCGSGTIPLVALLNGYNVIGSDIDNEAVNGTRDNVAWLAKRNRVNDVGVNIFHFDVLNPDSRVVRDLRRTSLQGLVCEPFMGPPQFKPLSQAKANTLLANVEALYTNLFKLLENIKLTEFKAVIVIPSYKTREGWLTLSLNSVISKKWQVDTNLGERDLHWKRSDSIIKRNIFVLSKKS